MHGVLFTPLFEKQIDRAGLSEDEVLDIVAAIAADPRGGDLIVGAGGARKIRHRGRGQGKSGGYRTIHYYGGEDVPLFLLALIDKGKKADLTQAERNRLAMVLPRIAAAYRSGES
jgi:hypothetical protein